MTMLLLPALLGCDYEVPLDPNADTITNVLTGTVVVNGAEAVADTVILLYEADNPPPPTGTGRPVSFATVPATAYEVGAGGVPAAEWALTQVPDGDWLVTALMDVDGNFQPLLGATAGSTCGDWLGAYFTDITTSEYATISVSGGELLHDITVAVGRENTIQRPAWEFVIDESNDNVITTNLLDRFTLATTGVYSEIYELEGPYDGTADCQTAFWKYVPDADGDGAPDAHPNENFTGYPALWPRVYLKWTGTVDDGYIASEGIPFDLIGVLPDVNTPTPATTYTVGFAGKAIHFHEDGTEEELTGDAIPKGDWAVTVVQFTGQTWTLPNELSEFGATDESFDPAAQALALTIE